MIKMTSQERNINCFGISPPIIIMTLASIAIIPTTIAMIAGRFLSKRPFMFTPLMLSGKKNRMVLPRRSHSHLKHWIFFDQIQGNVFALHLGQSTALTRMKQNSSPARKSRASPLSASRVPNNIIRIKESMTFPSFLVLWPNLSLPENRKEVNVLKIVVRKWKLKTCFSE